MKIPTWVPIVAVGGAVVGAIAWFARKAQPALAEAGKAMRAAEGAAAQVKSALDPCAGEKDRWLPGLVSGSPLSVQILEIGSDGDMYMLRAKYVNKSNDTALAMTVVTQFVKPIGVPAWEIHEYDAIHTPVGAGQTVTIALPLPQLTWTQKQIQDLQFSVAVVQATAPEAMGGKPTGKVLAFACAKI
jgi:hypothetical protein